MRTRYLKGYYIERRKEYQRSLGPSAMGMLWLTAILVIALMMIPVQTMMY